MPDAAVDRMLDWLARGGARHPALGVRQLDERERAAVALAPIASGDVVLQIPRRHMITEPLARASDIGRKIDASGVELTSEHTVLAAFLLQEKRDAGSFFRPYLDTLPASYRHMPVYFNDQELALLKGSLLLGYLDRKWGSLIADHERLCEAIPGFGAFDTRDFVWARLAVMTRAFKVSINGEKIRTLVPLADMLNHRMPIEADWSHDGASDAFTLTALRDIAAGQEIHASYGTRCNGSYFLHYGFVLDENPDNEAALQLSVPQGAHAFEAKLEALGGKALRIFHASAGYRHATVKRMLSYLRFALADAADLARLAAPFAPDAVGPLSARNEEAALAALAAAAEAALARFDTTPEQDNAALRRGRLSPRVRCCIVMRRGEKRVLRQHARFAADAASLLRAPRAALEQKIARPGGAGDLEAYIKEVALPLAGRAGR